MSWRVSPAKGRPRVPGGRRRRRRRYRDRRWRKRKMAEMKRRMSGVMKDAIGVIIGE